MKRVRFLLRCLFVVSLLAVGLRSQSLYSDDAEPHVAIIKMDMHILPGTAEYLRKSIDESTERGAKVLVVELNTLGGMLYTTQRMIQTIFKSPIPVVFYVTPSGASATSAGVFITLASHVAVMSPGTSIGAAHPVTGEGKDIEGDMRSKVENMTIAMVKSITDQRGRNMSWAEKAIKDSSSITEKEALKLSVIDFVAQDMDDLLRKLKGKEVMLESGSKTLEDYSKLPKRYLEMSSADHITNFLADPNILALLWLGATIGLSMEMYHPGAVLPGVVGVICGILALFVSQVIPVNTAAILLLITGGILIGLEFVVSSGILGVGGVISIVLGAIYMIDVTQAPDLTIAYEFIVPIAVVVGAFMMGTVALVKKTYESKVSTGMEGLVGLTGKALENFTKSGKVFVNGEVWQAELAEGLIEKDSEIEVVSVKEGLVLEVKTKA